MGFSGISSPQELKRLSLSELEPLAQDIRQRILSVCMRNGGHLGASLGAVELAIALHYVFDSPVEPILWDVGHQAYAHKLLTGRWQAFDSLRSLNGVSGFPTPTESAHDVFGVGHSSTALSAALGMAWARRTSRHWTVAVVGDGSLTAGLALEALNNFSAREIGPALIVLNDNQMSISRSIGAIPSIISGQHAGDFFERFGFNYIGPVDGHDASALVELFKRIHEQPPGRPVLVHAITQKGRGYIPAEEQPEAFHGVAPLTGKVAGAASAASGEGGTSNFSSVFGKALCRLAEKDDKIVAITAAMPEGTGLSEFARKFPERCFDVGIAEGHAITFAAGLAISGYRPVVAIYSSFLQRGFDQIIHDVALQRLGVTFAVDRAGLVGADGATHHGIFDHGFLSMIPGMTVFAPACLDDLPELLEAAVASGGPVAIRYPRGSTVAQLQSPDSQGVRYHLKETGTRPRAIVVSIGAMTGKTMEAIKRLDPEPGSVIFASMNRIKPLPAGLLQLCNRLSSTPLVLLEDSLVRGGTGEAFCVALAPRSAPVEIVGIQDCFVGHGSPSELEKQQQLSPEAIAARIQKWIGTV